MKTIRSLMTLAGLSMVALALGTTGARGQVSNTSRFAGTFTLPFEAHWGKMTLPAGDYALYYGRIFDGAPEFVKVVGKANGSPAGWILAGPVGDTSATRNAIVCVREGNALIVRALEMATIGESVRFGLPRGTQLTAHNGKDNGYAQLAEAPMLIQRIPVTLNSK